MKNRIVKWESTPPEKCDMCKTPIVNRFYDAQLPMIGSWGCICGKCFLNYGCSLGTGQGQQYDLKNGEWIKTNG